MKRNWETLKYNVKKEKTSDSIFCYVLALFIYVTFANYRVFD